MNTVRQWIRETTGGMPAQFWYVWWATLINRLGSLVLIVLAIYLTQERGLSESFAGLVIGVWGAGSAVGAIVGGMLADRWGRKPTLLVAMWGGAGVMLALGVAQEPGTIAVCAFAVGLVAEGARPVTSALMVDVVPERDRVRAFSLHYWVINVAFAAAATLAGFVASIDPHLIFLIDAATTAAAALFVTVTINEPTRTGPAPTAVGEQPRRREGLLAVAQDRVLLAFVGTNLLVAFVLLQHGSTLPMSMTRDGLPASTFGAVIALNGLLIVAGQFLVTRALRSLSPSRVLATACTIVGVGFGLTAFATTPVFYAATVLIWTVGEMFQAPANPTMVAALSPAHLRGRYQGAFSFSWAVAGFLAPVVGGAVLQHLGKTTLWLGCSVLCLGAAALHLAARASRERRITELAAVESIAVVEPAAARPAAATA